MDKKVLEKLLQTYFGCNKVFRTDGYSTSAGMDAANKLKSLLIDLGHLVGRRDDMNKIVEDISKTMFYGGELSKDYLSEYKTTCFCLEDIFQTYFGSKRSFKMNGRLTKSGSKAYLALTRLLYEIGNIYYNINNNFYYDVIVDILDYISDYIADETETPL